MIAFTKRAERLLQNGSEKSIQRPILLNLSGFKFKSQLEKRTVLPSECNNCFKVFKAIFSISIFELFKNFDMKHFNGTVVVTLDSSKYCDRIMN